MDPHDGPSEGPRETVTVHLQPHIANTTTIDEDPSLMTESRSQGPCLRTKLRMHNHRSLNRSTNRIHQSRSERNNGNTEGAGKKKKRRNSNDSQNQRQHRRGPNTEESKEIGSVEVELGIGTVGPEGNHDPWGEVEHGE